MAPPKPPLDLAVEITTATGARFQWGKGSNVPGDVPQNITHRTRRGDGFADGSVTLARPIDRDYADLTLLDDVVFYGVDGSTAYEGRIASNPRSVDATHSMSVVCAGHMACTRDRKMQDVFVDRDLGQWTGASVQFRANNTAFVFYDPSVQQDSTKAQLALSFTDPWSLTGKPHGLAQYYANGVALGSVYYEWARATPNTDNGGTDTNWNWDVILSNEDTYVTYDTSGNLRAPGPGSGTLTATTATRKYARLAAYYGTGPIDNGGSEYGVRWGPVAVYGATGITPIGSNPKGIAASDAIRYIVGKYCPKLNVAGVQTTTYPIPHLAFLNPVDPFDAITEINKYHRWSLGVWENKTLSYKPTDLTDYDWQIDTFDQGVKLDLQGDSTEHLANGIIVTYDDALTGQTTTLYPDQYSDLRDESVENPANTHGYTLWPTLDLSSPTTLDGALQVGRAALAEFNQPIGAGTITVQGHLKDRAGHYQQAWKVRADDRIAITSSSSLSDRPRWISETTYNHDTHTVQIAVESTFQRLVAFLDRLSTALLAEGIQR